jgi:spore germination protein
MYTRYVVQTGDTLENISNKFNVPVSEIIRVNGLEGIQKLLPGLELIIPPSKETAPNFFTYRVKQGDTLYSIGLKYKTKPEILALINGIELNGHIYPNQNLLIPREGVRVYITDTGDTLDSVAKLFNTTIDKLMQDNQKIYLLPEQMMVYREK